MRVCPHCAKVMGDHAHRCPHCGKPVEPSEGDEYTATEPGPSDLQRLAEIRRLQRIASGEPSRDDRLRRAKGVLALLIMVVILVYAYIWKEGRSAQIAGTAAITYPVFNAAFGSASPLSEATKKAEFEHYRGLQVIWEGTVVYVNRGTGKDLYASIRHRSDSPTSDVLLRFRESNRADLEDLPVGVRVRYRGRLRDYGTEGGGFLTLTQGAILERLQADSEDPSTSR